MPTSGLALGCVLTCCLYDLLGDVDAGSGLRVSVQSETRLAAVAAGLLQPPRHSLIVSV
jgi:hypothetical protein